MKAMLLAAGLGTRMRPLTDHMPKALVTVAGVALIDHTLNWLAASGIDEAVVNSFYHAEKLEAHLAGRKTPAIRISRETELLETGGGIKKALTFLGAKPFFSLNSDTICIDGNEPALTRMQAVWDDAAMDALLLLHPTEKAIGYHGHGDFFLNDNGSTHRRGDVASAPYVFTGVQLLHPRLFEHAPDGAFSMNVLYNRDMSRIKAIAHTGEWLHIGTPEERARAERWFNER